MIDLLRQTDPVRRMLAEAAERTAADRRALLDQLAAIETEAEATMPQLAADLAKAVDRVRAAEERLKGATQAFGATAGAKLSASVEFDRRRDGCASNFATAPTTPTSTRFGPGCWTSRPPLTAADRVNHRRRRA